MNHKKYWVAAIVLLLPIFVYYVAHFSSVHFNPDKIPTGCIQYDAAYYIANAKEYKEADSFHLTYPSAFSSNYHNSRIYFHLQMFVLGMIMRLTGIPPTTIFIAFGFLFSLLCVRICLILIQSMTNANQKEMRIMGPIMIWGGGIMVVAGTVVAIVKQLPLHAMLDPNNLFRFDPSGGYWFLNIGRNFLLPMEAYYHFIFFSAIYFAFKKKYWSSFLCGIVLAISHPYSGIQIMLILNAWVGVEWLLFKNKEIPKWSFALLLSGLLWIVFYNFYFLPQDAEHKILMSQWALKWNMSISATITGYFLVGFFAFKALSTKEKRKSAFADPFMRLLFVWLIINLALENHELFIKANQPLHFTRGYVWTCLFLIGAQEIYRCVKQLCNPSDRNRPFIVLITIFSLFFLDNVIWFVVQYKLQSEGHADSVVLTRSEADVLHYLDTHYQTNQLLLSQNEKIGYLSTAFTPYRSYYSHEYCTPFANYRKKTIASFFSKCEIDSSLRYENTLIVRDKDGVDCPLLIHANKVYENKDFELYSASTK